MMGYALCKWYYLHDTINQFHIYETLYYKIMIGYEKGTIIFIIIIIITIIIINIINIIIIYNNSSNYYYY